MSRPVLSRQKGWLPHTRPHWARGTTETSIGISDRKDPIVALMGHGLEINVMSLDFYRKGWWLINTRNGWMIQSTTRVREELHGLRSNVWVKIGDVELTNTSCAIVNTKLYHSREPYIMAAQMEMKVLDNGWARCDVVRPKVENGKRRGQSAWKRKGRDVKRERCT